MGSLPEDIALHQTGVQRSYGNILHRQVPKPSYRHAAPAGFVFTVAIGYG